jgi:hypothetical protein
MGQIPPFRTKSANFEFKIGVFGLRITQLIAQLGVAVCRGWSPLRGFLVFRPPCFIAEPTAGVAVVVQRVMAN